MAQLYTNRCHIPGEPDDPMAQLEVYPQRETIVLRIGVFPLESVSGGMIRSRHRRLRFSARSGPRRIGVTVSRSGAVDLRYRDETLARSEWEQGVLPGWESEQDLRPSTHAPTTAIFTPMSHSCAGRALFLY